MDRMKGILIAMIACAAFAVGVFFLVDFGSEKIYTTPQEVFEASRVALKTNNMRGFCQCLTDDSRDLIAASMAVGEYVQKERMENVGTDKKKSQVRAVDEVFAKHGLTEDAFNAVGERLQVLFPEKGGRPVPLEQKLTVARQLLKPVNDRNVFVADLFDAVLKATGADNPFQVKKDDKLTDVKIEGKVALGKGIGFMKGGEQPFEIFFRKQGEGWRIDLFVDQEPPPPHGGFMHNPH